MRNLFSIPLIYLVVAAAVGLLLRWNVFAPIAGFRYGYWLHAHSHVMFLGWVFNFLNLIYLYNAFGGTWRASYRWLFVANQFLITGMLIFFPIQGYGAVTIPLSVVHTVVSGVFCVKFILDTRQQRMDPARKFAVWSLVFFLISSLGPFALGPIMMQGLGQSKWYYFAIYFYLHFQYNGVFLFGVLSMLSRWLDSQGLGSSNRVLLKAGTWLAAACFPTYALSLLWTDVPIILNWIGFAGAAMQAVALYLLWKEFTRVPVFSFFQKLSKPLVVVVALSFVMKLMLQLFSAFPYVAHLAYDYRYYVIAYLHLVLIGVVTLAILIWYIEQRVVSINRIWIVVLLAGFLLSEIVMVLTPSLQAVARYNAPILFYLSVPLFLGFVGFLIRSISTEHKS
jgi:hypothetical protein